MTFSYPSCDDIATCGLCIKMNVVTCWNWIAVEIVSRWVPSSVVCRRKENLWLSFVASETSCRRVQYKLKGREKVNVIKVVKPIKAMADFETIKSKCGMSFFLYNPFWELLPIHFTLFARPRRSDAWGVFGLASHVKDFPLIFYVWRCLYCGEEVGSRRFGLCEWRRLTSHLIT